MTDTVVLTRHELYAEVWQQPITQLASRYGLSDVGLAKICRKHNIPRPPRGYWAKLQHGQTPRQIPLPNADQNDKIKLGNHVGTMAASPQAGSVIGEKIAAEKQDEMRIEVADHLRGCHKLVSEANQMLQSASTDDDRIIIKPKRAVLDVATSKTSLHRGLLIMDALLKAFEQRGYQVERGPTVKLFGVAVEFGISESVETVKEEPEEVDLEGPYKFGHSRFDEKRAPSGRLTLSIQQSSPWVGGTQRSWRDTDRTRLDDRLNAFVAGVVHFADRLKVREEELKRQAEIREQEELRRQEEAKIRAEKLQRYKAELARVETLTSQAENFRKANEVRDLIDVVRELHSANGPIDPDSEIGRWIVWATEQADRLDPMRPSPPSILDEDPAKLAEPPRPTWQRW